MKTITIAAIAGLALLGCGGVAGDEGTAGALAQPLTAREPEPPPAGPERLAVEKLFSDVAPLVIPPDAPTLADREHYQVDIHPPTR